MTPETAKYNPPVDNIKDFEARVKEHHIEILQHKATEVIWVITHNLVMKKVTKYYSIKMKEVPELGYFVISNGTLKLKY